MTTPEAAACLAAYTLGVTPDPVAERAAAKQFAQVLKNSVPGRSVEVRIPPYVAIQIIEGARHRRGTPPATVEMDARVFIELSLGVVTWQEAVAAGRVQASGERSNLSHLFPL